MHKMIHHLHLQNATENTGTEKKSYILVFGQRIVGDIDNSTKIVSSIVGNNLVKIEEESAACTHCSEKFEPC
jgi:hypothetical protein